MFSSGPLRVILSYLKFAEIVLIYWKNDIYFVDTKESKTIEDSKNSINDELQEDIYILGPGDLISIFSLSLKDINGAYEIFNDGSISIPLIGNINIEGMSIKQANKYIQEELGKEFLNPTVTLGLKFARPINISMIGEIQSPGVYTLSSQNIQKSNVIGSTVDQIGFPKLIIHTKKILNYGKINNVCYW